MNSIFDKLIGVLSIDQLNKLNNSLVVIFGLGGVGGFTFETLLRSGIGNFILIDKDKFEITNLNRQLASTKDTIGKAKVDVYKDRAISINENANIVTLQMEVNENNITEILDRINDFNDIKNVYVADCIDDVNAKISIMKTCHDKKLNLISSMGTANHISSKNIKIDKLSNTKYCPLAKKIRTLLKDNKEISPMVLYLEEEPIDIKNNSASSHTSTIQYVPAIAGMKIAEFIINKLL